MTAHLESAFEDAIVKHLVDDGWVHGAGSDYDRALGLDTGQLFTFIGSTQQKSWEKLISLHGTQAVAMEKFKRRLSDEMAL